MRQDTRFWQGSVAAALWMAGLSGCQQAPLRPQNPALLLSTTEAGPKITARQVADVQVALGRSLEMRGEEQQAMAIYREAVRRDPNRADAYLRLAILSDQQGKFDESAGLYRKALTAQPGNADIYCDMGYSLSLQRRWAEAEMNLRQAIALAPTHRRAHNNLGLVLAHAGHLDESLAEFRQGGCDEVDAHVNVAFVLTLERYWPEARTHYEQALALQPASTTAKKGLEELNALVAKGDAGEDALSPGNQWRRVRGCALEEATSSTPKVIQAALLQRAAGDNRPPERMQPAPADDAAPLATRASAPVEAIETVPAVMMRAADPVATPPPTPVRSQPVSQAPQGEAPEAACAILPPSREMSPPLVVSPLARLQQQVQAVCGDGAREVEVCAESASRLRIRLTVHSADEGYKLASKILWLPALGPYQVALDITVAG
jgi:tetratricopeptide (TPR) repeat protein